MADNAVLQTKATAIRKHIVTMLCKSQSGHPGGSLSAADIISYLYFEEMNIDSKNPKDENRDRFILSKGHAAPVLYAALAEKGFIEKDSLMTLREYGSKLQGHPDMKKVPGVEISTGSLGQGLSVANGMALAGKMSNLDYNVFVLMGDGEIQEGQVWEAAMTSAHYKLDKVIAFVDLNNLQIDGNTDEVMSVGSVSDKFRAFNWNVIEIDGHDFDQIREAVQKAKATEGKPTCIVADTVKGKGVDFMENVCGFHGVAPSVEETERAIEQLEKVERIDA